MLTVQDTIKQVVSSLHRRHLKGLDFLKSSNTWVRALKWSEVINIQLSRWNTSDEAKITLNFGVYIEALHEASRGLPVKGSLKEYDCDVRARIGRLHSDRQDYWWTVASSTDADELANGLFGEIRDFGLPWFESLSTLEGIALEFVAQKNPFKAAIAYHLAGMVDESKTSIAQALADSNEQARSTLMSIAKSLAIPIAG